MFGTDGLVDLGEREHSVAGVHQSFGNQLCVRHPWLGERVRNVNRSTLNVLQALGLFAVFGVENVLTAVVVALQQKLSVTNELLEQ
jgi:hypothetical protein